MLLWKASLGAQLVKNPPAMWETWVRPLGWEDPLEKGMATHCNILAWRIPRAGQCMRSQRVGHESAAFTSTVEVVGSGVGQMCFEGLIPSTSWVTLATQFLYEREVFLSIQWEC